MSNPYKAPNNPSDSIQSTANADWFDKFALITRHTILLLSIASLLLFIIPFYAGYFEGWELKPPTNLLCLIILSKWVSTYWYLAVIGVPLYYVVVLKVRPKTPFQRVLVAVWSIIFWLLAFGIFPFAAFYIASPFISITTGLSK